MPPDRYTRRQLGNLVMLAACCLCVLVAQLLVMLGYIAVQEHRARRIEREAQKFLRTMD